MSIKPASAKAKGSRLERQAAAMLGGKRSPLSGAVGGGDIWLQDSIFADSFIYECKQRKKLPNLLSEALLQAQVACHGTMKKPCVIFREDRGQMMIAFKLEDFVNYAKALSEVGQGHKIKALVRQAKRILDEVESASS